MKKILFGKEFGLFVLLVVLSLVVYGFNHQFLSAANLQNTARLIGLYGIFSLGLGIVIITGGIDLSVGSVFALLGVFMVGFLTKKHDNPAWAIVKTIAAGGALGLANGLLITRLRLQPFIVTLCGLLLYRGLARYVAHDETQGLGNAQGFEGLQSFASGSVLGLPTPFVILLVVSAFLWVALHRTVWGRHLYALGQSEEAARYGGVNTKSVVTSAYVLAGVLTGISAVLFAFYTNSISPSTHGNSFELYGIAAAVLGGCSLRGGEGSVVGVLIGCALLQVLRNLVTLLGIPSSLDFAVMGTVILAGVTIDQLLKSRRGGRKTA